MKQIESSGWADPSKYVKTIYVEKGSGDPAYAEEIAARAGIGLHPIDKKDIGSIVRGDFPENFDQGKKVLLLTENRGDFLKKCPGTRAYRCCGYQVINVGMGCPMDCTYCILQSYLNNPYLSFFTNHREMFDDLAAKIERSTKKILRIGTGEFTDSMALDRLTGLSRKLIRFFAGRKNAVLELKTKSAYIENLKDLDHNGNTLIAWSLNSQEIMDKEEYRTASLEERLEAAVECASLGYHLAFHFDPVIFHPGWKQGYFRTIDRLFEKVPADSIRWISIGAFRYIPHLKGIGMSRFPQSKIFYNEFVEGMDNKQRYFRKLRVDLYKNIYQRLKEYAAADTCIYFCMESDEVWQEVMGFQPGAQGGLANMLDTTMIR